MREEWKREGLSLRERANMVSNPARIHRMHDWMRFTRYYCNGSSSIVIDNLGIELYIHIYK